LAWKQQSKEKRARMRALAEQKKYGRPEEVDGETEAVVAPVAEATPGPDDSAEVIVGPAEPSDAEPAIADASGSGFDYSQDLTRSRFTVQVRIGPNGETIIDEESLTVDRTEDVDTTNYVHVVESDQTKFVNSASYTKKCRGSRWSAEETDLFYEVSPGFRSMYPSIDVRLGFSSAWRKLRAYFLGATWP
jgi:transcription factor TFIIIB component B''